MATLDIRTARRDIEQAIIDKLRISYGIRPQLADVPALRAVASAAIKHGALRYVPSATYEFSRFSYLADDGSQVVKPNDRTSAQTGRWLRTSSTATTGYAREVRLYNGEASAKTALEKILGVKPSFLLVWSGAEHQTKSLQPGSLYRYICRFDIWAISMNLRPESEAQEGSLVVGESGQQSDPGTIAMLGDVKTALPGTGRTIGLYPGVDYLELGNERKIEERLAQRLFIESIELSVYATVQVPDSGIFTLSSIAAQYELADDANRLTNFGPPDILPLPSPGKVVQSLAVTPASMNIQSPNSIQYQAIATYTDSTTEDVTLHCAWASSNTAVATIRDAVGIASVIAAGTTNITAGFRGATSNTAVITAS